MKSNVIIGLALSSLFVIDGNVLAERGHRGHEGGRRHEKTVVVKEPRRYSRTKVVVVKPRRVRTVTVLPNGYSAVMFGGRNYYYHGGSFFRLNGGVYTVIAPPIGIHIRILPVGYRRVVIGGAPYFYFEGVYYRQIGNEYETVEPTSGTRAPELPMDDVDKVTIDGQTYYEYDQVLYKPVVTDNGVQYEVAGKLDK